MVYFRTHLGFFEFLSDDTKGVNLIYYSSYKFKRVVSSVLGGVTHAFVNAFDSAFTIRHYLSSMLQGKIPLYLVTDSESLIKFIVQSSTATEKILMMVLQACQDAFRERSTDNFESIKSVDSVVDRFTKIDNPDLIQ